MRSSVRSSITSGVGDAPTSTPLSRSTTENGSAAFAYGNGTHSSDLANHPAIEFLAEATLVESEGQGESSADHSSDPPQYHPYNDVDNMTTRSGDISTLGPPPELAQGSRRRRPEPSTAPRGTCGPSGATQSACVQTRSTTRGTTDGGYLRRVTSPLLAVPRTLGATTPVPSSLWLWRPRTAPGRPPPWPGPHAPG